MSTLNKDQLQALNNFMDFALDPAQKYYIISGGAGFGKSFLINELFNKAVPAYFETCKALNIPTTLDRTPLLTATTNKAAIVLGDYVGTAADTIHSVLGLKVVNDYATGTSKLVKNKGQSIVSNKFIFIDEAYTINKELMRLLQTGTHDCKIIFIGDKNQVTPVGEPYSPIVQMGIAPNLLTIPQRNKNKPELVALCAQLVNTVETGVIHDIQLHDGVIDYMNPEEIQAEIHKVFGSNVNRLENGDAILAYTNKTVNDMNSYIRHIQGKPQDIYTPGEALILGTTYMKDKLTLHTEQEIILPSFDSSDVDELYGIKVCRVDVYGKTAFIPQSIEEFWRVKNYYRKAKNWQKFYGVQEEILDLRPSLARTVHKAQGSSYNTVYVNLTDLSTCTVPDLFNRLMYVAASRARERIVFYGSLNPRYGKLVR